MGDDNRNSEGSRGGVSLGLGTLIVIAVIVMFFSNRSVRNGLTPIREELDAIEKRLDRIEQRLGTPATQPTVAQPSVAAAKGE